MGQRLGFLLLPVLLLAVACSPSDFHPFGHPSPSPGGAVGIREGGPPTPACAELLIRSQASPNLPVQGAYACLTPSLQTALAAAPWNIHNDASMAAYAAQPPVFTSYWACGQSSTEPLRYFYDLRNAQHQHYGVVLTLAADGRVDKLHFSTLGWSDTDTCATYAPNLASPPTP